MRIILVHPEIPQNTGTIARICAVTGASLELVHPLGFHTDEKSVRRAGLDYWEHVDVREVVSDDAFCTERTQREDSRLTRYFYFTRYAHIWYTDIKWNLSDTLVFGAETTGLDRRTLQCDEERCVRIPQREGTRCHNLANAVAIAVYEVLRQDNFTTVT
jgi:tRNA (cytidine/uridine-2'-O-)-methyltransferase